MFAVVLTILASVVHRSASAFFAPPFASIPPTQLITSPLSCLSDVECPLHQYCKRNVSAFDELAQTVFARPAQPISTCVARLPEGSRCFPLGVGACANGTSCTFTDDVNPEPPTCRRQGSLGAKCALSATDPCQEGLKCQNRDGPKCLPFVSGFAGDSCELGCQVQQGFYCRSAVNQCVKRKAPGGQCGVEADNFECSGFCVTSESSILPTLPFLQKAGVCQRLQRIGEPCTADSQCNTVPFPLRTSRTVDVLCNRPSGYTGVCVRETELLRELGAACNPRRDACDARRGLSCGRVASTFRCVQRAAAPDQTYHFCTPNSALSVCPPDAAGNPRECRRALSMAKQFEGTFGCRSRRQMVPLGSQCNDREFVVCPAGAVCTEAPGDTSSFIPLATCMRIVATGGRCGDALRFKCEEGAFCVNKTCQRMEIAPTIQTRFAGNGGECSKLRCVPGRVCTKDVFSPRTRRVCKLPVLEMGLWGPCFESARFELVRCI